MVGRKLKAPPWLKPTSPTRHQHPYDGQDNAAFERGSGDENAEHYVKRRPKKSKTR